MSPAFVSVDDPKGRKMFPSGSLRQKKKKKGATGSNESANFHGRDACDCKEPFEVEA